MKTAGLVIDFYDDPQGSQLKTSFPSPDALPDVIKTAHILSDTERDVLRDEAFALVMFNEGKTFRKFACVDPGNTALSALYWLKNADSLPEEAQKVAAANIQMACEEFGLPVPLRIKVAASSASRKRDGMKTPEAGSDADWYSRTNLKSIEGNNDASRVMQAANTMKTAEALVRASAPRYVDVSGQGATVKLEKKASSNYALGDKYPLDSYSDVQTAISYFDENYVHFEPSERHEYACNTMQRADELGVKVASDMLQRYGSTEYAPDLEAHISNRKMLAGTKEDRAMYDGLREKVASVAPQQFVSMLAEADEKAGLNWHYGYELADPYFATFGGNMEAEKRASWSWHSPYGDVMVNEEQLNKLSRNGRPILHKHFSSDLTNAFLKDPVAIFESLPDNSKAIIARLANQEFDGHANN